MMKVLKMVLRCPHCNRICLLLEFYEEHQILHALQRKREAEGQKERGDEAEMWQNKGEKNVGPAIESTKNDKCAPVLQIISWEKEWDVEETNSVVENEVDPLAIEQPGSEDNNHLVAHLKCKHCKGIFSSFSKLLIHCFTHVLLQRCAHCKETYTNVGEYAVHMLTHDIPDHGNAFVYNRCRKCSAYFRCQYSLLRHLKLCHIDGGPLKCGLCCFEIPRIMPYQNHVLTHIGKTICICHICGFIFEEEEALGKHIYQHDPTMQSVVFQCFKCGICFTEKLKLMYHIYHLHNGPEPHFCVLCSQIYYNEHGGLDSHRKYCLVRQQQNALPAS